ncbi:hypothetical protein [Amycolatopsis sp. NPDC059021]|uniref:hypothetical protein n=1 Tax=Amycolatopsis sp. NPDC059021 TaxID=3346704 RepID=UPI00366E8F49
MSPSRAATLAATLGAAVVCAVAAGPADAVTASPAGFTIVNAASFEAGGADSLAPGGFLTVFTDKAVTGESAKTFPFPGTKSTPGGVRVSTDGCRADLPTFDLDILYVGPAAGGGTQLNVYYPNSYQGGRNLEPTPCTNTAPSTVTVHPSAGLGPDLRKTFQIIAVQPGIFTADSSGTGVPAGYHQNAVTGEQTPLTTCNADITGRACPVSTSGQQNFLVVFTTGAEMMGCPDNTVPCTTPFGQPTFFLGTPGSPPRTGIPQTTAFFGWAGFLGQEQANIQLTPATPPGLNVLSVQVPSYLGHSARVLPVRLGTAA